MKLISAFIIVPREAMEDLDQYVLGIARPVAVVRSKGRERAWAKVKAPIG